jgi:Protein of unknown function (DUF3048) N-terminal domain/Protein of unknown function (DUF3048) C-terminal domain
MLPGWTTSKRAAVPVAVIAVALALAGCEAAPADLMQHAASTGTPAAGGHASPSGSPRTWMAPLTGLAATGARAAGRAAVAVSLSGGQLQGLGSADVVYEELTSPVRYIAVFQSRDGTTVGPVGQTRPTDAQALSVLHPLTAYDGGTPSFIRVLDESAVVDVGYASHPSLYHPAAQGPTVSTSQVQRAARDTAPPQLFTYQGSGVGDAPSFASTGAWRTSVLRITAPGQATQVWQFDARAHGWRQVAGGPPVRVANVVVQDVPYKTVFLSRKFGLTTSSARVVGSGSALILSGTGTTAGSSGTAVKGTWSKPGLRSVTAYLDAKNTPIGLQRGTTWVILAPPGTRTATSGGRS